MHFLAFAIKRAHLRVIETFKPVAALYGLTPARFDLLHAVQQREGHAAQATIRHVLGVCAQTVSRMVQSLEELGFVRRVRDPRDRRTKVVSLTERGIWAVNAILEGLVMSGHFDLAFEGCFEWPARHAERTVRVLFKALRHLAKKMRDWSHHRNPGEPPLAQDPPWLELSPDCPVTVAVGL